MSDNAATTSTASVDTSTDTSNETSSLESSPENDSGSNPVANSGAEKSFAEKAVSGSETKPEAKQPSAQQKQQAAVKEAIRKMKIKVNGQEEELPEDEIIKLAQLGRASDKRFQEAAKTRKQAEDVLAMLKDKSQLSKALSNPAIGIDPYEWAQELILQKMEQEQLTPEQRRINELEQTLKEREDRDRQSQEQRRQEQLKTLQEQYTNEYKVAIPEALKQVGLPQTEYTQKRMVHYMYQAIKEGVNVEPQDIAGLVRSDYMKELFSMIGQADGDTILGLFGDQVANKIRKADLARLKSGLKPSTVPKQEEQPPQEGKQEQPPRYMSVHEWREYQAKHRK